MAESAEKPRKTWNVRKEGYIAIPRADFMRIWHDETEGRDYIHYAIAVGKPAGPDGGCGGEGGKPGPCPGEKKSSKGKAKQAATPAKVKQTETPQFKAWFSGSKVVDKDGKPLVVYHGTPAGGFELFDKGRRGENTQSKDAYMGFSFTTDPKEAESYSRASSWAHAERKPDVERPASAILPVYLSVKNPMHSETLPTAEMIKKARRLGHDGIIVTLNDGSKELTVFHPHQIKSATGNRGTFDPNSPKITESLLTEDETANALDDYLHRKAIDYLRSLVPRLGTDVGLTELFRRTAFTLAVATEQTVLDNVQSVLLDVLHAGSVAGVPSEPGQPRGMTAAERVQACLDAAGVNPANPQYAEAVVRTNLVSSYNAGYQDEFKQSELFPWYQWSNPSDSRSRPKHAALDGLYFDKDVPWEAVRGEGPENAINCRCTIIALDRWTVEKLKAKGATLTQWP